MNNSWKICVQKTAKRNKILLMFFKKLLRDGHRVECIHVRCGVLLVDDLHQFLDNVRVLSRHIVVFVDVGGKVVEVASATVDIEFPVTLAHTQLVRLVKFPIEEVVLLLLTLAKECGSKRDAVKVVVSQSLVAKARDVIFLPDEVAEGRHDVVES